MRQPLPVDAIVSDTLAVLRSHPNLVILAPPGAGKTTRIPRALLALGLDGAVIVLEPRRLAARMAARRVAHELGESPGATVGYQVRFEECGGPNTRLWYWTEGVLTRKLLADPSLAGVSVVVLDEFHERHIDTDLAIALLRRLQRVSRPDLRIVVMSATMAPQPVADYLGGAAILESEGRLYPLAIEHTPHSAQSLEDQLAAALERLTVQGVDGDILAFLPGAAEIRRAQRACERLADRAGLAVVPLHGDLSPAEQDRAVSPGPRPKLILSTNVAESSITIEGVTTVIDSGLARIAVNSPWTGLPSLNVSRISKASARQRAGRAGRIRPGRVIRLYSEDDFARRPEHDTPEIHRRELSQVLLDLEAMGAGDLVWFDPPPEAALSAARTLLDRLGATGPTGLTAAGREMARLPLHPRLARMVVEGKRRRAGESACAAAAALSAGDRPADRSTHPAPSDLLLMIERDWPPLTRRVYDQVRRAAGNPRGSDEQGLLMAVLSAFPDRVARRQKADEYVLAGGGSALLSESSAVRGEQFLVAVDIESRRERGLPLIRIASAIRPDWLLDLYPHRIVESSAVEWNRAAERVEAVDALLYDGLAIDETRGAMPDPAAASALLYDKAQAAGLQRFFDADELNAFLARAAFAARNAAMPAIAEADLQAALRDLCEGRRCFAELEKQDLIGALRGRAPALARLEEVAPARIRLPGGRQVRVNYELDKAPWIASRLQDFFGMRETPRIAGTPLVIHLLAPNHRPVQMTTDLAGFWERLYPQVRRELSRRYPRHSWPERPE
ncbi:MAG: ATP-dependent helicase HrpB [Acidobacteria bacterium]|nr:ATP-dependent helicase HrpB [Acidobacteriota bacterium]